MSLYDFSVVETAARRPAALAERRLAIAICTLAVALAAGLGPFRSASVGAVSAFLPSLASASLVTTLATAAILRFRYRASGEVSLAYLSVAYAFAACAIVPYALAFPGAFARNGLFEAGGQLSSYLWIAWHAGFIVLIGTYRYVERRRRGGTTMSPRVARDLVRRYVTIVSALGASLFLSLVLFRGALPPLVSGDDYLPLRHALVRGVLLVPCAVVLAELTWRTRLRRSSDLWLAMVVTLAFAEIYVGGELAGARFSLAWYVGGIVGLCAGSIYLAVQMRLVFELLRAFADHNRTLAEIAQHDSLTGLLNRGAFETRLESLWHQCRRVREPISLLVLDLDFFKHFNDHFGHIAGDEALRRISRELAGTTQRPTDLTCRIGGEEFAMILPFTDERGAAIVAERVILRVRALQIRHAPDLPIAMLTVSIGSATSHGAAVPRALLFELADKALYHAKNNGRDRVSSVRPSDGRLRAV